MTNPIIQTDIAEVLKEMKSDQRDMLKEMRSSNKAILDEMRFSNKAILEKIENIDKKLIKVETKLDNNIQDVTELKDTQKTLVEDVNSLKGVKSFIIPLIVAVTTTILTLLVRSIPAP